MLKVVRATSPPAAPVPTKRGALAQVGRVLMAEARLRLGPARSAPLPQSPAELTPEWLTAVLCRGVSDAEVRSVEVPAATSSGTTRRAALQVTYNRTGIDAGLPRHLFVKCTSSLPQRLMLGMGGLIAGEPGFYELIRPELQIEAPAGYFGAVDPASWRSIVVLEDVAGTKGARFCGVEPVDRAQIEDLIANVAAWHGRLWDHPSLVSTWSWLRTPAEQARLIEALIGLADRTAAGTRRAAPVLPAALRSRRSDLFEGMRRSLVWLGEPPHTYLHGDLHLANTYVTSAGRMGVCDWQVGMRGSWAHDLAYLLITALTVDERRAWERDLLALYLERLTEAGGVAPGLDAAWLAYRRSTLYPYFAWIYTLGRSRMQPHFQAPEIARTLIGRIAAAIEDLDSLGAVGL